MISKTLSYLINNNTDVVRSNIWRARSINTMRNINGPTSVEVIYENYTFTNTKYYRY